MIEHRRIFVEIALSMAWRLWRRRLTQLKHGKGRGTLIIHTILSLEQAEVSFVFSYLPSQWTSRSAMAARREISSEHSAYQCSWFFLLNQVEHFFTEFGNERMGGFLFLFHQLFSSQFTFFLALQGHVLLQVRFFLRVPNGQFLTVTEHSISQREKQTRMSYSFGTLVFLLSQVIFVSCCNQLQILFPFICHFKFDLFLFLRSVVAKFNE